MQGRVIPCDFIGVIQSQQSVYLKGTVQYCVTPRLPTRNATSALCLRRNGFTLAVPSPLRDTLCCSLMRWLVLVSLVLFPLSVLAGEVVSNHDELMCNFFAQADALACGKVQNITLYNTT